MTAFGRDRHDGFLRLFMEHEDGLRVFVRSLLFSSDEERDVMQEVAIVLWRKYDEAMDRDAFCRWAFGVARMEVLAFKRDRARDRHVYGDDVGALLAQTVLDHVDELAAERRALDACLEKLPADRRQLIQAAYASGVRIDQLAQRMDLTAMSLYKILHRLRMTLMDCTQRSLSRDPAS